MRLALRHHVETLAPAALEVALELGDPVGSELADALAEHDAPELFVLLARRCLESRFLETVALTEVCRAVLNRYVTTLQNIWAQPNAEQLEHLAGIHHNLGSIEERLNHPEVSLRHQREAVGLYRQRIGLDTSAPDDSVTLDGVVALAGLGSRLDSFGRPGEALRTFEEALRLLDTVTPTPEATSVRALVLHNFATVLGRRAQSERAIVQARESLRIIRRLAASDAAVCFGEADDNARALLFAKEAVKHLRQLHDERPRRFAADLAAALSYLSELQHRHGSGQAEHTVAEALALRRELASRGATGLRKTLAKDLIRAGRHHAARGDTEQARGAMAEAVGSLRDLAAESPRHHAPDLVAALGELSALKTTLGHAEGSRAAIVEALTIEEGFARANPEEVPSAINDALGLLGDAFGRICTDLTQGVPAIDPDDVAAVSDGLDHDIDALQRTDEPREKLAPVGDAARLLIDAALRCPQRPASGDLSLLRHLLRTVEAFQQALAATRRDED